MSQRAIIITILVLILAGAAYYIGTNREPVVEEVVQSEDIVAADPAASETSQALVGMWRSKDDSKFTREFRADGTITDRYEGEESATSSGTFMVFTSTMTKPEGVMFDLDADVAYIRAIMDGEGYNFRVSSVSANELELIYMDRGGMLRFERVQ